MPAFKEPPCSACIQRATMQCLHSKSHHAVPAFKEPPCSACIQRATMQCLHSKSHHAVPAFKEPPCSACIQRATMQCLHSKSHHAVPAFKEPPCSACIQNSFCGNWNFPASVQPIATRKSDTRSSNTSRNPQSKSRGQRRNLLPSFTRCYMTTSSLRPV